MAVIYARIGNIKSFRELFQGLPVRMEQAVSDRDERIAQARQVLDKGLEQAQEITNKARYELTQAKEALQRAKNSKAGPSEWHYRNVERTERAYDFSRRQLERLEEEKEQFLQGSMRCAARQDQALEAARSLGRKGTDHLDAYTKLLLQAKRVLVDDTPAASPGSFLTNDGGYAGARDLTEDEGHRLSQKTGWSERMLKKCQLRPDGSVWLKTNNSIRDGHTYNGTWFERDTVYIGQVRVEGIFPKFDAAFQPDALLPEEMWKDCSVQTHFSWCREQLAQAVEQRPALAAQFSAAERKLIAARKPLPGYTWHHHQQPGRMQLVLSGKHSAGMHGVNHTGGHALWCAGVITD